MQSSLSCKKKTDSQKAWEDITENQRDTYRDIAKAVLGRSIRSHFHMLKMRLKMDKELETSQHLTLREIIMSVAIHADLYIWGQVQALIDDGKIDKIPPKRNQSILSLQEKLMTVKGYRYPNAQDTKRHRYIKDSMKKLNEARNEAAHSRNFNMSHEEIEELIDAVSEMVSVEVTGTFTTGPPTMKGDIQVAKEARDARA